MGIRGDGEFPFEQPNLGPNTDQLQIIDGLDNLSWELRVNHAQYDTVEAIIDDEIWKFVHLDEKLRKKIQRVAQKEAIRQLVEKTIETFLKLC